MVELLITWIASTLTSESLSAYFNYKHYFLTMLMELVNADYKFLWVNMSATGSPSDAGVFNK